MLWQISQMLLYVSMCLFHDLYLLEGCQRSPSFSREEEGGGDVYEVMILVRKSNQVLQFLCFVFFILYVA